MNNDTSAALVVMALAAIGIIVALFLFMATPAAAVECQASHDAKGYWAWRAIDGRRCWYRGHRMLEKSQLHWPQDAPPKRVKFVDPKQFNELDAQADANANPLPIFPDFTDALNRWWNRWKP